MKKLLLLLALLPIAVVAQNYSSQNISMLGHWYNPSQPSEPVYGIKYQSCWGWHHDSLNMDFAIIGASDGTFFIDVTNPSNPVMVDFVPAAHGNLIWHEIKTYQNYCYIVSDDGAPNTFIICDLNSLPDSVTIVRNDNTIFERCHTIYVDGDRLWCGSVTGDNNAFYYPMAVYDLSADPTTPALLRHLDQDFNTPGQVHDMFVRNDTVYASGGFDGLFIYEFTGSAFVQLASLTSYPESGYNHSSFLTSDGNTLIFMDEVPDGRGIKSLDVSSMGNLTINQVFRSNQGNTPHNPYIIGNDILLAANYTDGLQIFNISNPSAIYRSGYFDSDTLINYPNYTQAYHGCWAAYHDFGTSKIIISDMQNGLYVLDITNAMTSTPEAEQNTDLSVYPNPFNSNFFLNITTTFAQDVNYTVYDAAGRAVMQQKESVPAGPIILEINADALAEGIYTVRLEGEEFAGATTLVKTSK